MKQELITLIDILRYHLDKCSTITGIGFWDIVVNKTEKTLTFVPKPGIKNKQSVTKETTSKKREITIPFESKLEKYKNHTDKKFGFHYDHGTLNIGNDEIFKDHILCKRIVKVPGVNQCIFFLSSDAHCPSCLTMVKDMPLNSIKKCCKEGCNNWICGFCADVATKSKKTHKQLLKYCFEHIREHGLKCDSFAFIFDYINATGKVDIHYSIDENKLSIDVSTVSHATAQKVCFKTDQGISYQYILFHIYLKNGQVFPIYINETNPLSINTVVDCLLPATRDERSLILYDRYLYTWMNSFIDLIHCHQKSENLFSIVVLMYKGSNLNNFENDAEEKAERLKELAKNEKEIQKYLDAKKESAFNQNNLILPELVFDRLPLFHEMPCLQFLNGWSIVNQNADSYHCPSFTQNTITIKHSSHNQNITYKFDSDSFSTFDGALRWDHLNKDLYHNGTKIVENDRFVLKQPIVQ